MTTRTQSRFGHTMRHLHADGYRKYSTTKSKGREKKKRDDSPLQQNGTQKTPGYRHHRSCRELLQTGMNGEQT